MELIDLVPVFFIVGVILGFVSGLLSLRCYFYITGGGIEKLYGENRPNVWKLVKQYKKDYTQIEDERLRSFFKWILFTRRISVVMLFLSLILFIMSAIV